MNYKKLLIIALSLFSTLLMAELQLEKTYTNSCSVTKINATDYKFFLMDDINNQCRMYNLDHSLYKTIDLSIPNSMSLYDVKYVTQDLFDDDSKIELLYVYYQYIATSTTEGYYKYYTKVINEDGTVLLNLTDAIYSDIKKVADDDYRLFIYSYDYSSWPYATTSNIYAFDGYPYVLKSEEISARSAVLGEAYPNPAQEYVTIPYTLEATVNSAQMIIYSSSGQPIKSFEIDQQFSFLKIATRQFLPGQYVYTIVSDGEVTPGAKFIVQ